MKGLTKKSIFLTFVLALISLISCLSLTACSFNNTEKITNDAGFVVEGGGFEKGCTLEANIIDSESQEYSQIMNKISSQSYDNTKPVYIFEISVMNNGVKVQPNGKVKVTVPISENLAGYDVLHIKDDGKIERLTATFGDGKATFETDSFSKFAFVKKISSGDDETSGDDDTTTKYTFYPIARRIIPASFNEGGTVRDINDEDITFATLNLAEGTNYTVKSHCYTDYYFIGWYEASELEEATEDTFISNESTYTFTINKNLNICALFAYKDDAVKFTLEADSCGFSYRNGKPTTTIVSKDSTDIPYLEGVEVLALRGDGSVRNYGSVGSTYFNVDNDGLDYSKVGTYTITFSHKNNANIKATLNVQVVDNAHTLSVTSTNSNNLKFRYNVGWELDSLEKILPEGRLVTLTAEPKDGYAFTGWYDEDENLVSDDLVYCFEMPNKDVVLNGKYESSSVSLSFEIGNNSSEGELVDDFGNAYLWNYRKIYLKTGKSISLTVRESSYYEFLGWFDIVGDNYNLITTNKTIDLTLNENRSIKARFREKIKAIEIDSTTLLNEGFVNGKVGFAIGDTVVGYENFTINAEGVAGSYMTLSSSDYIVDDSTVDFNVAGTYTISYTYKYDTSIKTEITIVVINPETAQFEFNQSHSYLNHEYNGKATFISLKDVKINGVPLYEFKSSSKIWDKISYKWIDKNTNEVVDTTDADITINGTIVKNFGPENNKMTIGNEFGGPIKAGSYRFELLYNGNKVLTQDSTISTLAYKKINTSSEFKTNEGSSWVNFELYYYTIVGVVDGEYYIMQMPSIGFENVEVVARKASLDSNGNIILGEGNDFAFVNARYYATDYSGYTEFLTGYYGSYVVRSSANTTDGTMFGSPYIYRTGYTTVSNGKIYRQYGNKSNYGISTTFDENGAVTIHSRYSENENGKLRLVKDGDNYVFTSVPADEDTRESYDIFIYQNTK